MDKVLVHKIEETDGDRVQEIEIFLNYIGKVELSAQELSEEELAEEEKKRKRVVLQIRCTSSMQIRCT